MIFERLFDKPFMKTRPEFLRYNGNLLELDGYCPELNLAFEYNGAQHYMYVPFFHDQDETNFIRQKERDQFKRAKLRELGIDLVEIPYIHDTLETMCDHIRYYLHCIFLDRLYSPVE